MSEWRKCYRELPALKGHASSHQIWLSPETRDRAWDEFLRANPRGQYQQSSLWAEYKAAEGWAHQRVVITKDDEIIAGFQILWKKAGIGRIGYLSKGPVLAQESPDTLQLAEKALYQAARQLRLSAVIVQQPDEAQQLFPTDSAFVRSNPMRVIEATYLVDVSDDLEAMQKNMSASLRRNLRKGHKQQTTVVDGSESDLLAFFSLMEHTCQRQQTPPNPGSVQSLKLLWRIFSAENAIRLTFADCAGSRPAAKLSLAFGNRLTVWKKGWDGTQNEGHPNEILEEESLAWAHNNKLKFCDFCSFGRANAEAVAQGADPAALKLSSRDEYHLRFGGAPKLLPPALILLPNPALRWFYQNIYVPFVEFRARRRSSAKRGI